MDPLRRPAEAYALRVVRSWSASVRGCLRNGLHAWSHGVSDPGGRWRAFTERATIETATETVPSLEGSGGSHPPDERRTNCHHRLMEYFTEPFPTSGVGGVVGLTDD